MEIELYKKASEIQEEIKDYKRDIYYLSKMRDRIITGGVLYLEVGDLSKSIEPELAEPFIETMLETARGKLQVLEQTFKELK